MFERDYLMREVAKLAALIARIAQLRTEGQHDVALAEIAEAYQRLSVASGVLDYVDPGTLLGMVGSPEVLAAIGRLMREEAELLEARGDPGAARRRDRAELLIATADAVTEG